MKYKILNDKLNKNEYQYKSEYFGGLATCLWD